MLVLQCSCLLMLHYIVIPHPGLQGFLAIFFHEFILCSSSMCLLLKCCGILGFFFYTLLIIHFKSTGIFDLICYQQLQLINITM